MSSSTWLACSFKCGIRLVLSATLTQVSLRKFSLSTILDLMDTISTTRQSSSISFSIRYTRMWIECATSSILSYLISKELMNRSHQFSGSYICEEISQLSWTWCKVSSKAQSNAPSASIRSIVSTLLHVYRFLYHKMWKFSSSFWLTSQLLKHSKARFHYHRLRQMNHWWALRWGSLFKQVKSTSAILQSMTSFWHLWTKEPSQ